MGRPSRKALYQRTLKLIVAKRIKLAVRANFTALDPDLNCIKDIRNTFAHAKMKLA